MKKERFYQLSIVVATAIFTIGCADPAPAPKQPTAVNKPAKIAPQKPSGITLSQLNSGGATRLSLEGTHNYTSGEPIRFTINTNNASGYIYIVYLDSKGGTGLLYPSPDAPPIEVSGQHNFPEDFGIDPKAVIATKDCQGCEKDKTVIYAFLSKEPILDIANINQAQLSNIVGGASSSPKKGGAKTKGIGVNFNAGKEQVSGNVEVGILEFFIK
jgi:hypothetical protein